MYHNHTLHIVMLSPDIGHSDVLLHGTWPSGQALAAAARRCQDHCATPGEGRRRKTSRLSRAKGIMVFVGELSPFDGLNPGQQTIYIYIWFVRGIIPFDGLNPGQQTIYIYIYMVSKGNHPL